MKKSLLVLIALGGLTLASAKSFTVTLFEPATIGSTQLKAGNYKVELENNVAVFKQGHRTSQAPVKVETGDTKYSSTTVRISGSEGKSRLEEIRLGGTKTKLVFNQ